MATGSRSVVSGAVFAVLVGALLSVASASGVVSARQLISSATDFPPLCECDTSLQSSPWRLDYNAGASVPVPGFEQYCFDIVDIGTCNPTNKCCNGKQGVNKVEFQVDSVCKSSLKKVTVDGKAWSAWEFNTGLGVLRVTSLNRNATAAAGTQVCLLLKTDSTCTTLDALCTLPGDECKYALFNGDRDCCPVGVTPVPPPPPSPSPIAFTPIAPAFQLPPPPPPRSSFPNCSCQKDALGSKLYVDPVVTITPVEDYVKMCFTVEAKDVCPDPTSKCCEFTLFKLEIEADPVCAPALAYTTVDGVRKARLFQTKPWPAIKVTNINKPFATAAGTEVCLFWKADSSCTTLTDICAYHDGSCTMALFTKPGSLPVTCCPTFTI